MMVWVFCFAAACPSLALGRVAGSQSLPVGWGAAVQVPSSLIGHHSYSPCPNPRARTHGTWCLASQALTCPILLRWRAQERDSFKFASDQEAVLARCDELQSSLAAKQEEAALQARRAAQLEEQLQAGRAAMAALQVRCGAGCGRGGCVLLVVGLVCLGWAVTLQGCNGRRRQPWPMGRPGRVCWGRGKGGPYNWNPPARAGRRGVPYMTTPDATIMWACACMRCHAQDRVHALETQAEALSRSGQQASLQRQEASTALDATRSELRSAQQQLGAYREQFEKRSNEVRSVHGARGDMSCRVAACHIAHRTLSAFCIC